MEFQKQTITAKLSLGVAQLSAMVGVGTGLAYHNVPIAKDTYTEEYAITHVPSGRSIVPPTYLPLTIKTEEQAKALLTELAALDIDAWNAPLDNVYARYRGTDIIQKIIELCHQV